MRCWQKDRPIHGYAASANTGQIKNLVIMRIVLTAYDSLISDVRLETLGNHLTCLQNSCCRP